jgi:hypothetical protein
LLKTLRRTDAVKNAFTAKRWCLLLSFSLLFGACRCKSSPTHQQQPSAQVSASAPASHTPPPKVDLPPVRAEVKQWEDILKVKSCEALSRELEPNLAYGQLAIAAKKSEFAIAWQYNKRVPGQGFVAFAGYTSKGQPVAIAHGLGMGTYHPMRVFPRGDEWVVVWFDETGLVFTDATWKASLHTLGRVAAISKDKADDTGMTINESGELVGTAPLKVGKNSQLGLITFAPLKEGAPPATAIGGTRRAHNPKHAAVALDGDGYGIAYEDEVGKTTSIMLTRFDKTGRELGNPVVVSSPNVKSSSPAMVATKTGALIAWIENEKDLYIRAITAEGGFGGPAYFVHQGTRPVLEVVPNGAILTFVRTEGDTKPAHVAVLSINAQAKPVNQGYWISSLLPSKEGVIETPSVAYADEGRVGIVFTYKKGMRSQFVTFKFEGCFDKK